MDDHAVSQTRVGGPVRSVNASRAWLALGALGIAATIAGGLVMAGVVPVREALPQRVVWDSDTGTPVPAWFSVMVFPREPGGALAVVGGKPESVEHALIVPASQLTLARYRTSLDDLALETDASGWTLVPPEGGRAMTEGLLNRVEGLVMARAGRAGLVVEAGERRPGWRIERAMSRWRLGTAQYLGTLGGPDEMLARSYYRVELVRDWPREGNGPWVELEGGSVRFTALRGTLRRPGDPEREAIVPETGPAPIGTVGWVVGVGLMVVGALAAAAARRGLVRGAGRIGQGSARE